MIERSSQRTHHAPAGGPCASHGANPLAPDPSDYSADAPADPPPEKFTAARGFPSLGALLTALGVTGGFLFAAWLAGLLLFIQAIRDDVPPPMHEIGNRDAIVVLTGGRERLPTAFSLLALEKGRALLVSGVHTDVRLADLLGPGAFPGNVADCCIVLGHEARNTVENAAETLAWIAADDISTVWLVTSNYHMPRSMVEFRLAMPDINFQGYPVSSPEVRLDDWWRRPGTTRLVIAEYSKFLYAGVRAFVYRTVFMVF